MNPSVVLVATSGHGSMDWHSQRLAAALGERCRVLHTDVYRRTADQFGAPLWSRRTLRALRAGTDLIARARAAGLPVHLANHHLARYGPALRRPYVVTVHDLIRHSDARGDSVHVHPPSRRDRRLLARDLRGIERAAGIIAVSRHTARALERQLGLGADRVHVVLQGIDHDRFVPVPGAAPLAHPYVLFVGSEHPRKNLEGLLEAFAQVKRRHGMRALRLVKIGGAGGPEAPYRERTLEAIARLGLGDDVILAGRVRDDELPRWYTHATCLVLPSYAEGFGLPPLEAMACGCPAIVSNAGALAEISGGGAIVVDPRSATQIADAITILAERPDVRDRLRQRGIAHAVRYTWAAAADDTVAAYARFLAAPATSPVPADLAADIAAVTTR